MTSTTRCAAVGASLLLAVAASGRQAQAQAPATKPQLLRAQPVPAATPLTPQRLATGLRFGADLAVGMLMLGSPDQTPYKSGEMAIPFGPQMSVPDNQLGQDHLYVSFRWSSPAGNVAAAEWQVVVTPCSYDTENWRYPPGIVARGPVTALPARGQPGYFVVDFAPIFRLPPDHRLLPPPTRAAAVGTSADTRLRPAASVAARPSLATAGVSPQLQLARLQFARTLEALGRHRMCFVRLVLLDDAGQPVGVSSYATVRTATPTAVTLYPGSVPAPQRPANLPSVKILGYHPAVSFSPDDRQGRFIVLSNCPKLLLDTMKWTPGQEVHLQPKEKSGLAKVGEAIGDAFDALSDLVDWISRTWSSMQATFVDGICGGNDTCKACAGPALKAGLMAVGIPPELPTTADLCSMGRDYVTAYLASQTGVPEELIRSGVDRMADIVNNPPGGQGAAFLWPNPRFQDRPACIDVEVHNPGQAHTEASVLWLLYGSSLGDVTSHPPQIPPWLDTRTPLPPLAPGQTIRFPIFLTRNPQATISHGSDSLATYMDRRVEIRDKGGQLLFVGKVNWWGLKLE